MKRKSIFLIILIISLTLFSCTKEKEKTDTKQKEFIEFKTYNNFNYGFSIKYPEDWGLIEDFETNTIMFLSSDKSAQINFGSEDLSMQPMKLNEYTDFSIKQLPNLFDNTKIIQAPKKVMLSGIKADKVVYEYEIPEENVIIKVIQVWTIKNNKSYILAFIAEKDKFDSLLEISDEIIDSFKIIEKPIVEPLKKPFLWKIKGKGIKDSYLYGTIHITDERVLALPEVVLDAIKDSDAVYTEVIFDSDLQIKAAQVMRLNNQTLEDLLPKEIYEKTADYFKSKRMHISMFSKIKIWGVFMTITSLEAPKQGGNKISLDVYISRLGSNQGKEIGGLEKPEEQFTIFDSLTLEEQIILLNNTLNDVEKNKNMKKGSLDDILEAYLSGDEDKISKVLQIGLNESDPLLNKINKELFIERNHKMTDRIIEKIKSNTDKSYFFTIGAGHYPGKEGILELLIQKGFIVERVKV